MILFPAIDLKGGNCVRLVQGDFAREQVFSDDPVTTALRWQNEGGAWLHLVDLEGALSGAPQNREAVKNIVAALSIPVQLGGGIRSMERIREYLELGLSRVIIGTAAIENKGFLREALDEFGEKIAVSIDAKNGMVALKGWTEVTDVKAVDLAEELADFGLRTLVYTDIAKDGMMQGPNFTELARMQEISGLSIIASGGVSSPEDVAKLAEMQLYGAIIGKALYTGDIDLEKTLLKLKEERNP